MILQIRHVQEKIPKVWLVSNRNMWTHYKIVIMVIQIVKCLIVFGNCRVALRWTPSRIFISDTYLGDQTTAAYSMCGRIRALYSNLNIFAFK